MSSPIFLPWLRRGLARGIGGADDPAAALPLRATVRATVGLEDSRGAEADASTTLPLVGPGDVVGLDAAQVVRQVPSAGSRDAEVERFPFVELVAPDLPWTLTPARAGAEQRLRPWLVLVCVEQRDGVEYADVRPLPVLRLRAEVAAAELPDLAESWAWAHVQSMVPVAEVEGEVTRGSGAVFARLVCPRRLRPGRSYRAALVPAFDVGRAAGLGEDTTGYTEAAPAWRLGALPETLELPAYLSWTFSTGAEAGDFEALARRLAPDREGGRMGIAAARVEDGGLLAPFDGDAGFEYEGILIDPGTEGAGLGRAAGRWFRDGMVDLLERAARRPVVDRTAPRDYDPAADDPVIAPPLHGCWGAGRFELPNAGWLRELNLDPRRRAAAGLGARVVRENQHELLAAAWDQAGELRELNDELNRGRLAGEIGRRHAQRLSGLPREPLLQATSRLHLFVPVGRQNAREKVERSAVLPSAMVSPAFARQTRPGATLARRAGRAPHAPSAGTRSLGRFVAASVGAKRRAARLERLARFGGAFVREQAVTARTEFRVVALAWYPEGGTSTEMVAREPLAKVASTGRDNVTGLARAVRRALDPMPAVVAGLRARVGGVALDRSADLPARVPVGPRFPDPLFSKLAGVGAEYLIPGLEAFGANRVRLLAVNEAWIAAFLAGANHEWAREALWHEFPADLGATAFSTFWPRVPAGDTDLRHDVHLWPPDEPLASQVGGSGTATVLVVRGDLIRRYPDAEFLLLRPGEDGAITDAGGALPPERTVWPAFAGTLDAQTAFVGFEVDPRVVWGERWYIGVQEAVAGPRFGLDAADRSHHGRAPRAWADASWGHVAESPEALEAMTHLRLTATPWLAGIRRRGLEWGRNAAHLAGITFQQPFRLLMPARYLMPPPGRSP